jgi:hypothetical protein
VLLLAGIVAAACSQTGPYDDGAGGTGAGSGGNGVGRGGAGNWTAPGPGTGGGDPALNALAVDLVSDFEGDTATVALLGGRNGTWYAYNDGSTTCSQTVRPGAPFVPVQPPVASPAPSGGKVLRAQWADCNIFGAGIGANLCVPVTTNGEDDTGPPRACDLRLYTGLALWARATPGTDTFIRVKLPMLADLNVTDGGWCDETQVGVNKCSDSHGQIVRLPSDGSWRLIRLSFTDPSFKQEGWGAVFAWDPTQVVGIQIQSADVGELYEVWIDDVYLLR